MSRFFLIVALALVAGCSRTQPSGPPTLRVGRDECAECGMIINEDRCSSALLLQRGADREYANFDDIRCMLDYLESHAQELQTVGEFVHDYNSRAWIDSAVAVFLLVPDHAIKTPMGSGIVAFADAAGATRAQAEFGGITAERKDLPVARTNGQPAPAP